MYKETLRQVWAEIDMSEFDHNVKEIKKQLDGVPMIGVIKANGYGHGATECAKVLKFNGVDHYAVATIEEGINLRNDGIEGSIVLLGFTPSQCVDTVIEYGLTPTLMHYEYAKALSEGNSSSLWRLLSTIAIVASSSVISRITTGIFVKPAFSAA